MSQELTGVTLLKVRGSYPASAVSLQTQILVLLLELEVEKLAEPGWIVNLGWL